MWISLFLIRLENHSPRAGAEAQRGALDGLGVLRSAAAASDGVIHLAFKHDIAFTGDFQGAMVARRASRGGRTDIRDSG